MEQEMGLVLDEEIWRFKPTRLLEFIEIDLCMWIMVNNSLLCLIHVEINAPVNVNPYSPYPGGGLVWFDLQIS